jgi:2'-5' RNA ligase
MRLFVAVWPPPDVAAAGPAVAGVPGMRRVDPTDRHVTLAFLGEVPDAGYAEVEAAVTEASARVSVPPRAVLGPCTVLLGRSVLCVPVAGLDAAASAVRASLGARGIPTGGERFLGHLTLARRTAGFPPDLVGVPVTGEWDVGEILLVASHLGTGTARYELRAAWAVGGGSAGERVFVDRVREPVPGPPGSARARSPESPGPVVTTRP